MEFNYAGKPVNYYQCVRPEMLDLVPASATRILDVGCGSGLFGRALKERREVVVWGVEPEERAAAEATSLLDRVVCGKFDEQINLPPASFDCIIFNDVLEHLAQPEDALALAKRLLVPSGQVVASIPNVRHFPTLWRLVMEGRWDYTERGILDATHLRFFTRASILKLFAQEGFAVTKIEGINAYLPMEEDDHRLWRYFRWLARIPGGLVRDMSYLQFALVATARTS